MDSPLKTYAVLVTRPGTRADDTIAKGAGIVSQAISRQPPAEDEQIDVHFEGNGYGLVSMRTYEERVRSAAERLMAHTPTIARFNRTDFLHIGTFTVVDDWRWYDLQIDDVVTLDAWLK